MATISKRRLRGAVDSWRSQNRVSRTIDATKLSMHGPSRRCLAHSVTKTRLFPPFSSSSRFFIHFFSCRRCPRPRRGAYIHLWHPQLLSLSLMAGLLPHRQPLLRSSLPFLTTAALSDWLPHLFCDVHPNTPGEGRHFSIAGRLVLASDSDSLIREFARFQRLLCCGIS